MKEGGKKRREMEHNFRKFQILVCKVTFSVNELSFIVGTHQLFTKKPIYSVIILMACENHTKNLNNVHIYGIYKERT